MDSLKFKEMLGMLADPYYDREFFSNLIYCMDRHKGIRELFEGFVGQINETEEPSDEVDRSLLQLFYAFQSSSLLNESYRWLPIAQAFYSAALFRSDGQKVLGYRETQQVEPRATTLDEFARLIRCETRAVESSQKAWASLLFLLENRTSRAPAVATLLGYAALNTDPLSLELLSRAIDVAMAYGWKSNAILLHRAFERFWSHPKPLEVVSQGWRLSKALSSSPPSSTPFVWNESWADDLWDRLAGQSAESALESIDRLLARGMSCDQILALLSIFRGRCLFTMKSEQWPRVTASILYADSLQTVARWCVDVRPQIMATSVVELAKLVPLVGNAVPLRPTGAKILDGSSQNISKDRLLLRLDDLVSRGERFEALEVMAVILKDQGLSNSVCDRLILMASKQDAWTFDQRTLSTAVAVTRSYDHCLRAQVTGPLLSDAICGLLRFLSDERDVSLEVVAQTGTYGNKMSRSQYDVSGGARIVDRFVFNEMRNAQRVKVWPSQN